MSAAFGICAAVLGRQATGEGAYVDVSMTDVLATWTGRSGGRDADDAAEGPSQPVPGYGLFSTADGGQVALGVLSEQYFWTDLCAELRLGDLAGLGFEERSARGSEMQRHVAAAIEGRGRDELVAALTAVSVPVAPVLDRRGMLDSAALPGLPDSPAARRGRRAGAVARRAPRPRVRGAGIVMNEVLAAGREAPT